MSYRGISHVLLGEWRIFLLPFATLPIAALTALKERILSRAEQLLVNSFAHPNRRAEWLAGRIVAKAALRFSGETGDPSGISILPQTGRAGPPCTRFGHLSISHSHGVAAAVHSRHPVGLDIERVRPFSTAVRAHFLTDYETQLLPEITPDYAHTLAWCSKEALVKSQNKSILTGLTNIRLASISAHGRIGISAPALMQDQVNFGAFWGNYALAISGRHA